MGASPEVMAEDAAEAEAGRVEVAMRVPPFAVVLGDVPMSPSVGKVVLRVTLPLKC